MKFFGKMRNFPPFFANNLLRIHFFKFIIRLVYILKAKKNGKRLQPDEHSACASSRHFYFGRK